MCTSDEKAKLALFESEAQSRTPEVKTHKFLPEWRDNVTALIQIMRVSPDK